MKCKKVILITGANGEVGHGLIEELYNAPDAPPVVAMDVHPLGDEIVKMVDSGIVGDILDLDLMNKLDEDYEIEGIYHLAALLSTSAEHKPELAHRVNSQGTINLLELCTKQAQERNEFIKFIFPSSIGVFGVPDLETKARDGAVREEQHLTPITMYGCSK